jgi:cyclopropane fatty-acyl-phospholipid synthase-like methyltransferase
MAKEEMATGFRAVDHTTDPDFFVRYLDTAGTQEQIQTFKRRTFELLEVKAGYHLLDVGCGTGDDVRALAPLVGSTGRVVGVDHSGTMIAEARKRAEGLNLCGNCVWENIGFSTMWRKRPPSSRFGRFVTNRHIQRQRKSYEDRWA